MLKNKCSVWKRIKFPTFWYNCYYFTWSDTYFIQLETLLINHPSYYWSQESISSVILCHLHQSHVQPLLALYINVSTLTTIKSAPYSLCNQPYCLASAGGNPQNKDTICSIFSPKCNTIYKCEIHFNNWISFLYLHININVMMIFFLL